MKGLQNPASRMRYRLTLQQRQLDPDGGGGYSTVWEDVADIWAEMKSVSAREAYQSGQLCSKALYKIIIRYRDDMRADMRFSDGSRIFHVQGIIRMEPEENLMEILAEEGIGE